MHTINVSAKHRLILSARTSDLYTNLFRKDDDQNTPMPWPYLFLLPLQFFHSDLPCLCPRRSLGRESCFSLRTGAQQWNKSWTILRETHSSSRAWNKETWLGKTVNTPVGVNSLLQVIVLRSITCYASQAGNTPSCRHYPWLAVVFKSALRSFNYCLCGWRWNSEIYLRRAGFALFFFPAPQTVFIDELIWPAANTLCAVFPDGWHCTHINGHSS